MLKLTEVKRHSAIRLLQAGANQSAVVRHTGVKEPLLTRCGCDTPERTRDTQRRADTAATPA